MTKTIVPALIGLALVWPLATGVTLPNRGPKPAKRPEITAPAAPANPQADAAADETEAAPPASVPKPDPKPATPPEDVAKPKPAPEDPKTETSPKSEAPAGSSQEDGPSPKQGADTSAQDKDVDRENTEDDKAEEKAEPINPPPPAEDPQELAACLAELKAIGASFEVKPVIDDAGGCGMASPVILKKPMPDVALEPEATLRCETALQLSRMTRDMIGPAAAIAFPDKPKLSAILQASGYVCRNRNSAETGKVSEHAYGNAIDIAGLRFGKEDQAVMIAKQDDGTAEAAFQRAFNAFACLYFTTVLSPGSDATHQDHMHLDVIERKSGYRYCR
ncbi:extensin family protein [Peteryoungia ipomoeae]|uniref:Extensin n=1 Tax=Peteryoungia ipomoeae TaxID=1210932 RepID=A0A4S8NUP9_9HYPH|nr:extensin family protein [Peteryoungia ipomoeae]THV21300.1 extensin [Peteryoungia ipomoeae]